MSTQTTLTENAPRILDATCSSKKLWPAQADVRVDIKAKWRPDVVADDCALPFRSDLFDRIYCDPPHIIGKTLQEEPTMSAWYASQNRKRFPHQHFLNSVGRFGTWPSRAKWLEYVKATNIEFARIIKKDGLLLYKLCESRSHGNFCKLADLDGMTNFEIIAKKETQSKFGKNRTYWLTMKPKAKAEGKE